MTDPRVGVRNMNGIPIVELPDHRGFDTADELADAILAKINSGSLPPATKEQTARATAAAMMQQLFMRKHGKRMLALRGRIQSGDVPQSRQNIDNAAEKLRKNTAALDRPTIGEVIDSGVSAAVNGQSKVLKGSSGEGDDWMAGLGFEELEQLVYAKFGDEGHPIRRLWRGLNEKLDN